MGLSIAHTMNNSQFENQENLRNAARNILNRQNASKETTEKMLQTVFGVNSNTLQSNSSILSLASASQFVVNNNLKETLKNLKLQTDKKNLKAPMFGEIWESFNKVNLESEEQNEFYDFEIDGSAKNIFIAA